jgi:hypothetical protein
MLRKITDWKTYMFMPSLMVATLIQNLEKYIQDLENYIQNTFRTISSIIGRYYAMDRDKRWERINSPTIY